MTANNEFRFSIQMPFTPDRDSWIEKVQRAEALGFYSISVPDHLGPSLPQLAPLVSLAAAAMVTSRIRLSITVLNNDLRHPTVLAKEIATLDLLSNGRVDMGIGAGWLEEDLTKTGIGPWDPPGTRVSRLFESIELLRELLSGNTVNFDGTYYQVKDFVSVPTPLQQPLPIMLGGGGKRMLQFGAQNAQIISVLTQMSGTSDTRDQAFQEQLSWIKDAGGFDRSDLTLGVRILFSAVGKEGRSREQVCADAVGPTGAKPSGELSTEELLHSPFGLIGSPADIARHVRKMRDDYGITYFTVSEPVAWELGPVIAELSGN